MFEKWGFLLSEIWGLLLLAALLGLLAGWLIWARRSTRAEYEAEITRLRADLAARQAEADAAGQRVTELEGEMVKLRMALEDASQLASSDGFARRVAELEAELAESQRAGAELADRNNELAEELAECQRDASLMVGRVSELETELDACRAARAASANPNIGVRPLGLAGPRGGQPDDLKLIKGIGPVLEELCHRLGYYHFDQIASWTADEVAWVDENLEGFKGRVTRDEWVQQARDLAAGLPPRAGGEN